MPNVTWRVLSGSGQARFMRLAFGAALAGAIFLLVPSYAGAVISPIAGTSPDGSHVYIQSFDPLLPADTDANVDVYERAGGVTSLVSTGPSGGNGAGSALFRSASADGSRIFFETGESLVPADTDTSADVYERAGGQTTLISAGQINGNGAFGANLRAASADGSRVFFVTSEALVPSDIDFNQDIYERSGGVTTKVSNGIGAADANLAGASSDGGHVFFDTSESLSGSDTDGSTDIYDRSASGTTLVSAGQINGNGVFDAAFSRATSDGGRVFFSTSEKLVAGDTDALTDVYERSGGTTTRVSAGQINGNGAFNSGFVGASADGSRVFFQTAEPLVAADTDASIDIYERSGGTTTLVSAGQINGNGAFLDTFGRASSDGNRVIFETAEQLVAADTDASQDIYERSGATTTLISSGQVNGNGAFGATFGSASTDGSRVFFSSGEALVPADTDTSTDEYERSGGVTSLVSAGRINGNGAFPSSSGPVSDDATHAFFLSAEQLVPGDTNTTADGYERFGGQTRLVTTGKPAPAAPTLSVNPKGPANQNSLVVTGAAEALSTVALYATASCAGTPLAVVSAESLTASGIADTVGDNTNTSFSATATDANNWALACSGALNYTEDSKAPKAKITKHPKKRVKTRKARAKVTFKLHSEGGAKLKCKLDHKPAKRCGKSKTYKVKPGKHTFRLTATDAAGNTSKPTVFKFKVIRGH